jgi:hypothetical protein
MRLSTLALSALLLLSGCRTLDPFGSEGVPSEWTVRAEQLQTKAPEDLTEEEVAFLAVYADHIQAYNQGRMGESLNILAIVAAGGTAVAVILAQIAAADV